MNPLTHRARGALAAAILTTALGVPSVASAHAPAARPITPATFNGATIDLARGWGGARACVVRATGVTCYASEAAAEAATAPAATRTASSSRTATATASSWEDEEYCASYLRLYSGSYYTGFLLMIDARGVIWDLADYGMNNTLSSYRVGACSVSMFDSWPATGTYPGSTYRYSSASTMVSGWNNRVGSVYIW